MHIINHTTQTKPGAVEFYTTRNKIIDNLEDNTGLRLLSLKLLYVAAVGNERLKV